MEKKNNSLGVIILVFIFLISGLAAGYYISDSNILGLKKETKSEKKEKKEEVKEVKVEVNSMILDLYNSVINNNTLSSWADETVFGSKEMKAEDMEQDYKDVLASKYFRNYVVTTVSNPQNEEFFIEGEKVKNGYDRIFGVGTYKTGQNIKILCATDIKYDNSRGGYVYKSGGCGGTSASEVYDSVVSATKKGDALDIIVAYAFRNGNALYKNYEDAVSSKSALGNFNDLIGTDYVNTSTENVYDKIYDYVEKHIDNLEQYRFSFEQDESGFYRYVGFKRIKE